MAAPAQVTYTSNVFASPEAIGLYVTIIGLVAGKLGVHIPTDDATQAQLTIAVGVLVTGIGHYLFPGASGKLGLTAPMPWANPTLQDVQAGTNVVAVPAPGDVNQTTGVVPLPVGSHKVDVTLPSPPLPPPVLPPTVVVTPIPAAQPAP